MAIVQSEGALVSAHRPPRSISTGVQLRSGDFASYEALFKAQPNVRTVNGFLARNIAQLGLHAFTAAEDDERVRFARSHPLTRLIRQPNPYVTRYAFTSAMVYDLGIYDVFIAIKLRNRQSGELRLFRIPPSMAKPVGDNWLVADAYELKGSKTKIEVPRDQLFVIHGYHPTDPRVGTSPLESLRGILAEEAEASVWRSQYWRRSARISGVIERPGDAPKWSDTARKRFRSDFQSTWTSDGELAGATPILEEGMTWKTASFSPKDSEYLSSRRLAREEVAAAYWVSPLFVGILDHANFSNMKEQHKHLYQDTLGPRLVEIEEEWERQILPEFSDVDPDNDYVEFNLAEKLKGTFEEQATVIQTMVGAPVLTRDEGRARLNLPKLPNGQGEQIVTPLNVLVGGQASPRDSAPTGLAGRGRPLKALERARSKAVEDLPPETQGWQAKHAEVLAAFFTRQQAAVMSRLGAGQSIDDAWDTSRWDGELEADLYALAVTMTGELAGEVAETFGGSFDDSTTLDDLQTASRTTAENVNATTKSSIATAMEPPDGDEADGFDPLEAATAVFAAAVATRATEIAVGRSTAVASYARHEGARQAGVPAKVWRINSTNPRSGHPSDGETVELDAKFSNGARWPGDAGAGIDQTAGCTCSLEFTLEAP